MIGGKKERWSQIDICDTKQTARPILSFKWAALKKYALAVSVFLKWEGLLDNAKYESYARAVYLGEDSWDDLYEIDEWEAEDIS